MAYAAVVSLIQNLENIHGEHYYQIPWEKKQIESLVESMACFHHFLARSWKKRSPDALCLEKEIRDAAHEAEDVIESYMSKHFFAENGGEKLRRSKIVGQHLKMLAEEVESIRLKVTRLEDLYEGGAEDLHDNSYLPLASGCGDYTDIVEFEDVSLQLMDRIVGGAKKLLIIPVVGMGGIGKTTLVKTVFKKSVLEYQFEPAAWVTVSQNYRERDVLLGLLESMRVLTYEMCQKSVGELSDCLYKCLKGKRYLIVMDDMWHKEAWDNIKRLLPHDNEGSRVLLTTRLSEVATHANWFSPDHHHMRLLDENEGWKLLCSKVFRDGRFIPELEEVGKEIVRSCKGLPLSIVVVSGLLSNVSRTQIEWGYIAKNFNQVLISKDRHCTEVFSLSYDHMPYHLKACFLYTGVYPQDFEIPMSKLIKLWIAEGFIKMNGSKSLQEVGEEYLEDLVSRNLVMVGEKRFNGKIKSCIVHDLLKEWCLSKALDEKFIHTLNANIYYCQEIAKDPRRLCIRKDSTDEARADILRAIGTFSLVRSLVSQSNPHDELWCCKLLRVLDLSNVDLEFFPSEIIDLIHLRYVYVCCGLCDGILISKYLPDSLRDLQTLIICQRRIDSSVCLPRGIWGMRHLRHLQFGTCYFPHPLEGDKNSVLENLQTLSYVSGSSCTEEFIKRIPNAKKLGIRVKTRDEQKAFSLRHLMNLCKLEILKCIVEPRSCITISKDLTLPKNLIKLTLSGTKISWKDMFIVGSLPNLEVLKLKNNAFQGLEWEPIKGEFCRLKSLLIEGTDLQYWRAEKENFPILERLILWECTNLEKIPFDFVNLQTLESIELDDASPSAVASARQIEEEILFLGKEELHICVYYMWEYIFQKRKEKKEEAAKRRREAEERWRKEAGDRRREAEDRRRKEEDDYWWREYHRSMSDNDSIPGYDDYDDDHDDDDNSYEWYIHGRRDGYGRFSRRGSHSNLHGSKSSSSVGGSLEKVHGKTV